MHCGGVVTGYAAACCGPGNLRAQAWVIPCPCAKHVLAIGGVGARQLRRAAREVRARSKSASGVKDARHCLPFTDNCSNMPIEVVENRMPVMFLAKQLRPDSGGPGKYRGGGKFNEIQHGDHGVPPVRRGGKRHIQGHQPISLKISWLTKGSLEKPCPGGHVVVGKARD